MTTKLSSPPLPGVSFPGESFRIALASSMAAVLERLRSSITRKFRTRVEAQRLREALRQRTSELAESQARFCSIVERTADGIVIVDEEGKVQFVNPAAEGMFALPAAALVGQDFGRPLVAGEAAEMDVVRKTDDEPIVAELRVSATTWDGAKAQVVSLRDVTDRKHAEEQAQRLLFEQGAREQAETEAQRSRLLADIGMLLDSSASLQSALDSLPGMIVPNTADWFVIDLLEGGQIRRVACEHKDPLKRRLLERSTERFPTEPLARAASYAPGQQDVELDHELGSELAEKLAMSNGYGRLLSQLGARSILTLPMDTREQQRLGLITFGSCTRDFDEAVVALAREIASRIAHALEKERLYEAALAANRAKSEFLAVVSHELRTPLNAITGYTDLLLAGVRGEVDDTQSRYLRRIDAGAMQLLQIIDQILMYAHAEAGHTEPQLSMTRVGDLVDDLVTLAEPLVQEKGLEFTSDVREPDATISTDAGKVREIALNLLTNAIKFTEEGSVRLRVDVSGDDLELAISDTGRGIAPEELEQIFEPFRQVEQGPTRRVGGTGLGLSVARQLARILGGDIRVESTPGRGSTFLVRLPQRFDPRMADRKVK